MQGLFLWVLLAACLVNRQTSLDELIDKCKKDTIVEENFGTGHSFTCELNDRQPPIDNFFRTINSRVRVEGRWALT